MSPRSMRRRVALLALAFPPPACAPLPADPAASADAGSAPVAPAAQDASMAVVEPRARDGGLSGSGAPHDAGAVAVAQPLVDQSLWQRVGEADDPFDDRPDLVECPLIATAYELLGNELVFDVDTGQCNYLTVVQPTLREVAAGARLRVRLFHFDLNAPEPAEAHAAVLVGGLGVLDERVPIPASGSLIAREVRAERAIAAGTPIYFHLHNHGQNSWALVELSVLP